MITTQTRFWTKEAGWSTPDTELTVEPQLVFVFGDRDYVEKNSLFKQIQQFYPEAYILSGSTSGNILNDEVTEESVTVSALHFEKTKIWFSQTSVSNVFDSELVGKKLAEFLPTEDLVHSFVLSDGLAVNGSDLVRSINEHLPDEVTVTGGLAGDGTLFEKTVVGCNAEPGVNTVSLIGFYSNDLKVGYASAGGWEKTGNSYTITRSKGNVLYELNNKPALDVYKKMMGAELAAELPSSGLFYPLSIEIPGEGSVVRTILNVNEENKSVTFAGDMPENLVAHILNAGEDQLIKSAGLAAQDAVSAISPNKSQFALLVSCVGRKLVLKDRIEEEVKAVRGKIGEGIDVHGFYSYGELCPGKNSGKLCLMHNQTMTVTTFSET